MAELLRRWLRDSIDVDIRDTLEKDLASGYKIGEILYKCNLQPDFSKFMDSNKPDALINNFTRLQPTLNNLGIKMDTNVANDLMAEKQGIAARILYAIKSSVEGLENNLAATYTTKLGSNLATETKPTSKLVESQRFRTQKQGKLTGDLRTFEETMRTRADPPNKVMEAMHLKKFEDEMIRQTQAARDGDMAEAAAWMNARDSFRGNQLGGMSDSRRRKTEQAHADFATHRQMLDKQNATELEELRVEMTLHQKRSAKLQTLRAQATSEVIDGIEQYENNLRRIGSAGDGQGLDDDKLPPIGPTPFDHIQRVRTLAPLPDSYQPGASKYLDTLHTKKKDETAARKEREARRRRVMVQQQRQQAELESKAHLDLIVDTLQRESAEEQRLAARMWQLQREKDVVTENRKLREQQYSERMQADLHENLKREAELFLSMREQYEEEAAAEMEMWRANEDAKATAKRKKHEDMCRDIVWATASVAFRAAEYREAMSAKVPRKEYRDWIAMFVAGDPALLEPLMKDDKVFEVPESASALDEGNLSDYLATVGEWDSAGPLGHNDAVGKMVAHLAEVRATYEESTAAEAEPEIEIPDDDADEDPPATPAAAEAAPPAEAAPEVEPAAQVAVTDAEGAAEEEAPKPDFPVKLAVIGAPFSGKTSVARHLAKELSLKVISPVSAIGDVVKAADEADAAIEAELEAWKVACEEATKRGKEAPPKPAPEDPAAVPQVVTVGRQMRERVKSGEELDDETVLDLILMAIDRLGPAAPVPTAEPPVDVEAAAAGGKKDKKKDDSKDAKKDKKKDKGAEEPVELCMGYVLDGFPANKKQSQMLEKAMTGLDLSREEARRESASRVAPPPPEYTTNVNRALMSGLDHVFVLGIEDEETIIKRALGRRIDPETGKIYHLEFDPPPDNLPGHTDKLEPVEDESYDAAQVQERLRTHVQELPALEQWLHRFVKLRLGLDAAKPVADIAADAKAKTQDLITAKSASAAATAAAEAAASALAAAKEARAQVLKAKASAKAAARDLLSAKKAELQAAAELAADPAAAQLVKDEASSSCAEHVLAGNEALRAAEAAAQQAEEAARKASEAVNKAIKTVADAGLNAQAQLTANEAAQEAKAAAEEAANSAARAKEAAAATAGIVSDAQSRGEQADKLAEEAAASAAPPDPKAKKGGGKAKGGSKGGAAEDELSEIDKLLTLPPDEPEPEDPVPPPPLKKGVDGRLGKVLHQQWEELESNYLRTLTLLFAALRQERTDVVNHFVAIRKGFAEWINRPDKRPVILAEFQHAFNAIDADLRKRPEVIGELLLRADELRDALWDVCDKRLEENEAEHSAIVKDSFVEDHTHIICAQVQALIQVEMDKYYASVGLAQAYACAECNVLQPTEARRGITSLDLGIDTPPPKLEGFFNTKSPYNWPEWITALEPYPKFMKAVQIAWGLVVQESRADSLPGLPGQAAPPEAEDAAAGKGTKKKLEVAQEIEHDTSKYNMDDVAAAREMAGGMVSREMELLRVRLKLLVGRVHTYVEDLRNSADIAQLQCQDWLRKRYHSECSSVQSVHGNVIEAVEVGTPMPHDLRFEGEDVIVDEASLSSAMVPPPAETKRRAADNSDAPDGVLSTAQLAGLAAALREAGPKGLLPIPEAAGVMQRVGSQDGGSGLPEGWRAATFTQVATALRLFDPHATGFVDWRDLLGSLVAASFPCVPSAGLDVLASASASLASADADSDGMVTKDELLSTPLWFDTDGMSMAAREEAANTAGGHARGETLKSLLFDALSTAPTSDDAEALVDWRALLLCLCMDFDMLRALQKGFAAMSGSGVEGATLSGEQIAAVAYPFGPEAGQDAGRSPRTAREIGETVAKVAESRGAKSGEISAEQLMYSLAGNQIVSELLCWMQLKDPFSALRL